MATSSANYETFAPLPEKNITAELDRLTPQEWKKHPDYGQLPYFAPCTNCVELIHKRTDSTRYFIENNTNGTKMYLQTGKPSMHFRDPNGYIRERLQTLFITEQPHVFRSILQEQPVEINIAQEYVAFYQKNGRKLSFNQKLELWAITHEGEKKRLASASWKNGYTAGVNGARVFDVFPDIDMEINSMQESVKTNFVVKKNTAQFEQYRYIFIKDQLFSESAVSCAFIGTPNTEKLYVSDAVLYDADTNRIGTIKRGFMFDSSYSFQRDVFYDWKDGFNLYVKTDIFTDPNVVYPIVIDPTVQLTSTIPIADLSGSKYASTCWDPNEYCASDLTVNFPPNVTFTDVKVLGGTYTSWLPTCNVTHGAMRIVTGTCISPHTSSTGAPPPYFWKCLNGNQNASISCLFSTAIPPVPVSIFASLFSCLPAPSCSTQTQVFSMQLFRCADPTVGCGASCITASTIQPFSITIVGETLAMTGIDIGQGGNSTICQGDSIVLKPNEQYGVPTYTYDWLPNGETSDSIKVAPIESTTYTVIVTDLCGASKTSTKTITVKPVTHTLIEDTICEMDLPYTWANQTITTLVAPNSPEPYHILHDTIMQNGCPNPKELHLIVHPTQYFQVDTAVCTTHFPFTWNGLTIPQEGQYTYKTSSHLSCDSIVTLHVAIKPDLSASVDSSVCEHDLPLIWNGISLLTAGTYLYVSNDGSNNCDSVTTLHLNVLPTLYTQIKEVVYEEDLPVLWFGNTISDIGVYVHKDTFAAQTTCDSVRTIELTVLGLSKAALFYVPNTFTPQGDGYNEVFIPIITEGINVQDYAFEIYDRWGQLIFFTSDILSGWNGLFNGQPVPQGVYTWRILINGLDTPDSRWVIGHVNVVR